MTRHRSTMGLLTVSSLILSGLLIAACGGDPDLPTPARPAGNDAGVLIDAGALPDAGGLAKSDVGDTGEPAWEPKYADFDAPCAANADCASGFCVEGPDGSVCTEPCVDTCAKGWGCQQVYVEGRDVTFACVPAFVRLCRPCTVNSDCRVGGLKDQADACIAFGDAGSFCGADCATRECPSGYDCLNVTLQNGISSKQCVPSDGADCACRDSWAALELSTTCAVSNDQGSCQGTRTCGLSGLSACDAATPKSETCNGQDDDCNGAVDDIGDLSCEVSNSFGTCTGVTSCTAGGGESCSAAEPAAEVCNKVDDDCDGDTDEETCADGIACTVDLCQDDGGCSNPVADGACWIDGTCYVAGAGSPTDPCLQCLPDVSKTAWSNAAGLACDDGEVCTQGDTCADGVCSGTAYTCSDGLECTADTCDGAGGCVYVPAPGTCAIGTACWSDGDANPENGCLACRPDEDGSAWSARDGESCDDGQACTKGDTCAGDTCAGTSYVCDDQSPCTEDSCDGAGGCLTTPTAEGAGCDDGEACTKDDTCTGGICAGTSYVCEDGDGCSTDICDGLGGCSFEAVSEGQACNDGDPCTVGELCTNGQCSGSPKDCSFLTDACNTGLCNTQTGACEKTPVPAACNDGDPCTQVDSCVAGVCQGTPLDCTSLDSQCGQGVCVQGSCQKVVIQGACNDNNPCTQNDVCQGDVCTGVAVDCSYLDDPCNEGVCSDGGCIKQPKAGLCNDNDPCTDNDQCNAGSCQGTPKNCSYLDSQCTAGVCQGGQCQSQPKAGGCDDGDPCTQFDQCVGGMCQGSAKDCSGAGDACNSGVCVGGSCVKQPKGGPCNDGDSCTTNDWCVNGTCQGNTKDCGYLSDTCNAGVCSGGICIKSPQAGACNDYDSCTVNDVCVGGACLGVPKDCSYLSGACSAGLCQGGVCVSQPKSGACNDGNSCTNSDYCQGGQCIGTPMTDNFESNNSYRGTHITDSNDCQGLDNSLNGNLYPNGDVDWYWFSHADKNFCDVNVRVQLIVPSGADYQLCAYFECKNGENVDLSCPIGNKVSGPKGGVSGCCSTKGGAQTEEVKLSPKCSTFGAGDESGFVDVKVYKASGNTCSNYTLKWGDDG